jgi:hypothetical protein
MARLHRPVEDDETAVRRLGTALEGLEVEAIAGHEVLAVTPFGLSARLLSARLDGRVWDARLLIRREYLFVVHGGRSDSDLLVEERRITVQRTLGTAPLMQTMDQREGRTIDIYPFHVGDGSRRNRPVWCTRRTSRQLGTPPSHSL